MTIPLPERTWTHDDRSAWRSAPGPWDGEPDKVQWVDPATGLDCLAVRNHMGAWCGHVGVGPGHSLHGRGYGDLDVEVHGGLTYAAPCTEGRPEGHDVCHVPFAGRPADVWWFGFDRAHAFDLVPSMLRYRNTLRQDVYRDLPYVRAEVARLAGQLAGLA